MAYRNVELDQIRYYRLRAHHLDKKIPLSGLIKAAGACGLQNSPPGAWETALFNRLEGVSLQTLHSALYKKKSLLQAWSFRGVPVVFPTEQSSVFLTSLISQEGEQPWIYTLGISGALEFLQMSFDDLLLCTRDAARHLDHCTIKSKEALDQTLADIVESELPREKRALWRAPSMYGNPDRQTVGGAAVSFLLRPCSFSSLVVFGERQGISPTFTSFQRWTGRKPDEMPDVDKLSNAGKELTRKFLHCYGPATLDSFMSWLGCSRKQALRLWNTLEKERETVLVGKKTCYMLSMDMEGLLSSEKCEDRLVLLGAHDPYLDMKDRAVLLSDKSLQKSVWKTVANPGAILKGGRIIGIWKTKTQKDKLDLSMSLFEALELPERKSLKALAGEYAQFRLLSLRRCDIDGEA